MLINYAIEKSWDIYNIYCDEDYSGIDSRRPEFNKLLEDAKSHKFDIVLCKTQSRFTRDMEIVEKYLHNKFIEWNIRFVSLVDHVDTLDKGNKKQSQGINFKNQGKNIDYWCESTVSKILKNEVYIGNLVQGYNKKLSYKSKKMVNQPKSEWIIVENTHEPIITKEQFYKVQEIFKSKTRRCKNGEVHLFANKLVCLDCGTKLYKCQNDRGYIYFSCKGSKKLYGTCTPHSIGYENLKNLVTEKIKEKILAFYNFDNISDDLFISNDNFNKAKLLESKKETLSKDMESINKAIKELYLNKVSGKVPEDIFEDLNASFLSDKSTKQKELSKTENDLSNLKEKELNSKFIKEQKEKIINHFKDFKVLNYDIVNSFIDYIEIGEKNKKTKTQDILIHWNF